MKPKKVFDIDTTKVEDDFSSKFTKMLQEISGSYTVFPFYVLEIMAENYGIPLTELKFLLKSSQKEGFLIHLDNNSYKIKS